MREYIRRYVFCVGALFMIFALHAQSVVSFGLRGGMDFMLPKSNQSVRAKLGMAGAFDMGYTHYWPANYAGLGVHTGLSVGYATSECQIKLEEQYTNYDYLNNEMLYTTTGKVNVYLKRAYAELPLMLALRSNGFILQLGVKAQYSFWSRASQRVEEASIDAYYVPYGVHVTDELITGIVSNEEFSEKNITGGAPSFNILAATRIGYETRVGNKGLIGFAAYLDYNVWNNLSLSHIDQPLIAVAPISNPSDPVPAVTVNSAFNTVISRLNPLQIGISFYYAIEFESNTYYRPRSRHVRSTFRYNPNAFRGKSNRYRPYYSIYGRH